MGEANEASQGLTLAVIGAGKMGTAVLSGILANRSSTTISSTPAPITKFIATVQTPSSAQRLKSTLAPHLDSAKDLNTDDDDDDDDDDLLTIHLSTSNLTALRTANVVLLACKPYLAFEILTAPGVRAALAGKFLISVLAGSSPAKLEELIYPPHEAWLDSGKDKPKEEKCRIMRATPNMAASVRASETLLDTPTVPLPARFSRLAEWIFGCVGGVRYVSGGDDVFNAASVLTGAGMAFLTVAVDGMLDGAVAEGVKRVEAREMLARTLGGLAKLLGSEGGGDDGGDGDGGGDDGKAGGSGSGKREGMHPAVLREEISSPRGTTIRGLLALEEGRVRMSFAKAVMDATARAKEL